MASCIIDLLEDADVPRLQLLDMVWVLVTGELLPASDFTLDTVAAIHEECEDSSVDDSLDDGHDLSFEYRPLDGVPLEVILRSASGTVLASLKMPLQRALDRSPDFFALDPKRASSSEGQLEGPLNLELGLEFWPSQPKMALTAKRPR